MKSCPNCFHKPCKDELKFYPEHCSKCGTLYSAIEIINEKKRRENENLKAWRVTKWRAKNGRGLIFGVPAFLVILFIIYQAGHLVIAKSKTISNTVYKMTKEEDKTEKITTDAKVETNQIPQKTNQTYNEKCILTVETKKTVTLWLIHQETKEKHGPILITRNKPETIELQRGVYTAKIIDNGKIRISSVSILDQKGKLDL